MKQNIIGAICLSLAASIWGSMYVVSKYVLDFIPPFTLVWLRYVIAFVVLFSIFKVTVRKHNRYEDLTKRDWLLIGWIGFIGYFVSISFQFIGTKLSDAHMGALITSATPAFVVIIARILLKEKLSLRKVLSLVIATLGVVIVIGWNTNLESHFWGNLILVGAALTWALLTVYVKIASQRISSFTVTTFSILFAIVFTTPAMLWEIRINQIVLDSSVHLVISGILYLGIFSTAIAFFLWNKGMELMDAGFGSLFFFFQPIVGSLLGWLLLQEKLDARFFIGGTLIIAGVLIVMLQKKTAS